MLRANWKSLALALSIVISSSAASAPSTTQVGDVVAGKTSTGISFRLIALKGSVLFLVPSSWGVLGVRSQPPVSVFAFQVPNPADQDTPESTNVAVTVFQLGEESARSARAEVEKTFGVVPPKTSQYESWTIFTQEAWQGQTLYTVMDAVRDEPGVEATIAVRMAWPHLASNSKGYDSDMIASFHGLLESIFVQPGNYTPAPNEVVRRPTQ